nr:pollen-specific leucine-rich repeat extensin-like protein 4 [Penaeus vannamei]
MDHHRPHRPPSDSYPGALLEDRDSRSSKNVMQTESKEPYWAAGNCQVTEDVETETNCLVDTKDWSDCGEDLLACLTDYDVISVQCFSIPPRETLEDIENYLLKSQNDTEIPYPSSNSTTPAPSTLKVTAYIHYPPTYIPPIPLPLTPSQHSPSPTAPITADINPPPTHIPPTPLPPAASQYSPSPLFVYFGSELPSVSKGNV